MQQFRYKKSFKIIYRNCCFRSLPELRFAISIEDTCSFLREHVQIWYDPKTKKSTNYIQESTKKYTPDVLIRDKSGSKAWLVEIKPRAFQYCHQLYLRKQVAENYIQAKGLDWSFVIVFDDEIKLTLQQEKKYKELCKLKSQSAFKIQFEKINNRYDRNQPRLFKTVPDNTFVQFVKYGSTSSLTKIA
jgi:hypothetical protein